MEFLALQGGEAGVEVGREEGELSPGVEDGGGLKVAVS